MINNIDHKTVSLADQIFERLERDILVGKYERGEILTEIRLSETLGVSRTPIREAMRRLEQECIIKATPKGSMVVGISPADIEAIYEMRLRIEGLAARYAAENATDADLVALKDILELQSFYINKKDAERIMDCDSKFHRMVYEATGSVPLCNTLTELHKKIIKFRRVSVEMTERARHSFEEHIKVYEAIAARDGERADKLMTEHVSKARENIRKKIASL
jgi:DNA-binding GntR family transcriptional regulator